MAQLAALLKAKMVDAAAHDAATSDLNLLRKPSAAQSEAGNYRKGHTRIGGLSIAIENPAGSRRRPEWPAMVAHYGYVKRTTGADGDAVDVFVQPGTPNDWDGAVFVIDQTDGEGGFDEHKAMLGYDDQASAVRAYAAHFPDGWEVGAVTALSLPEFKAWLRDGDTTGPVAKASGTSLARLLKSEDQPRDELGRFASAGGGSSSSKDSASAAAGVLTMTASQVLPKALLDSANKAIKDHADLPADEQPPGLSADQLSTAAKDLEQSIAAAHEAKPAFDKALQGIAKGVGGTAKTAGIKGGDRLLEKHVLENGSNPANMRDLVRGTIIVDKTGDVPKALDTIGKNFEITRVKDRFDSPLPTGYRDMLVNVRLPGGIEGEIQVHIPEMIAAKSVGHRVYDIERKLPDGHKEKAGLVQMQSKIYASALKANAARTETPSG